jgi:hypothetical protein
MRRIDFGLDGTPQSVPITARTATFDGLIEPAAYDCMTVVIREGSAVLMSAFGRQRVGVGDVVLLAGNMLCGGDPDRRGIASLLTAHACTYLAPSRH